MSAASTPTPPSPKEVASQRQASRFMLPSSFIWRRIHSLMGIFLILFLIEHLVTNSQAALWIGHDGSGFVRMVERIHSLPYLHWIEWSFLGVPLLIHLIWGLRYAKEAKFNSLKKEMNDPYMPYGRSQAFTFQRLSAWFLAFAVLGHIIHLRVLKDPIGMERSQGLEYVVKVHEDDGLCSVADRLGVQVWDKEKIHLELEKTSYRLVNMKPTLPTSSSLEQKEYNFISFLDQSLKNPDERLISTSSVGLAMLMVVRDVFKAPWMCVLYSIFVLSAVYHACNGLWTSLIKWGVTPSGYIQRISFRFCLGLMGLLSGMGLSAIWLTYWVNLVR